MSSINYDQYRSAEDAPQLEPPKPSLNKIDDDDVEWSIRCVCQSDSIEGLLVQCEKCHHWLHGDCVFLPRGKTGELSLFYCPFCLQQKIRCRCGQNCRYNEELVQCTTCHFYVHRKCEIVDPLKFPIKFVCANCSKPAQNDGGDGFVI